jgi:hypothetical protein
MLQFAASEWTTCRVPIDAVPTVEGLSFVLGGHGQAGENREDAKETHASFKRCQLAFPLQIELIYKWMKILLFPRNTRRLRGCVCATSVENDSIDA